MTRSFDIHIAPAGAMMRHYDPARIHGYCASCPDHGRFWSCPPFAGSPLDRFPAWDHVVLVFEKTRPTPDSTWDQLISRFHEARWSFRSVLLDMETRHPGVTALVAGYCQGCEVCTRPEGQPCRAPSALRYSLEAVGFDVTGLSEGLAGQKLLWSKDGVPEYLLTVGALLCQGWDRTEALGQALMKRHEEMRHG